jgi:hypothetical protein
MLISDRVLAARAKLAVVADRVKGADGVGSRRVRGDGGALKGELDGKAN